MGRGRRGEVERGKRRGRMDREGKKEDRRRRSWRMDGRIGRGEEG